MRRLRGPLARAAHRLESVVDRIVDRIRGPLTGPPVIEPYLGYSTPDEWIARARILARHVGATGEVRPGRLFAFLRMVRLFLTREVAEVTVHGPNGVTAVSDEEGYVSLVMPRGPASGWVEVPVTAEGRTAVLPVQVTDPRARFGVITDIDDTVIHTGAWSLGRNLWTSLTGSVSTREVFQDAVALLAELSEGGRNPVFYVSSSPWNLHGFLEALFRRADLVRGPLFLRDLGISRTKLITAAHSDHKGSVIDRILAANPRLPFVMIGDTGQHDAAVYAAAAQRHPGRITRVILRRAGRDAEEAPVAALRAAGIRVDLAEDYAGLLGDLPLAPGSAVG